MDCLAASASLGRAAALTNTRTGGSDARCSYNVNHTGADGFTRLARQALFDGQVQPGANDLMVDDFIGHGGTMANFRGFIEAKGGRVIGGVALTGKPYSSRLALTPPHQLAALRNQHADLENWWSGRFGFGFDAITESEARDLVRTADADTVRNRIAAPEQAADGVAREGAGGQPLTAGRRSTGA